MKRVFFIAILLITGQLVSCSGTIEVEKSNTIVCTTGMIGDAIKNIVGNKMNVHVLMGPGVDPHLYKVVPTDVQELSRAEIVCYNGLHLEGKMTDILKNLNKYHDIPTLAFSDGLSEQDLKAGEGGAHDPHIWFDVSIWSKTVSYAGQQIAKLYPEYGQDFIQRTERYVSQLDSLHQWVTRQIASIPKNSRVLITAHDAFGYFGNAYEIEVRGLQGISTVSQAGIKDRKDLVDMIIKRNIKAIFVETSISDKQLNAIVEDCKKQGHSIQIGGNLYSDAMGIEGSSGDTYIGMIKANVTTIVNALK